MKKSLLVPLFAALAVAGAEWVHPQGLPQGHNGGFAEQEMDEIRNEKMTYSSQVILDVHNFG